MSANPRARSLRHATAVLVSALALAWLGAAGADASDIGTGQAAFEAGDYRAAYLEFKPAAEAGEPDAQFWLGRLYEGGHCVQESATEAFAWFIRAAQQGHPAAQLRAGDYYAKGNGIAQDYERALMWYLKAADRGNTEAQRKLAVLYRDGKGSAADPTRAAALRS